MDSNVSFSPVNDDIDSKWAGFTPRSGMSNNIIDGAYFDYYFSGQDVRVYVDGTFDEPEFQVLPFNEFGYNVSQQKMPLYGFWSYTYDAVLRGVRLIEGKFILFPKSPDYMRRLLEKAADTRATQAASYQYYRGLTEDDTLIDKYWGKNLDPGVQSAGKNIFSAHPPFSFIIAYGVQSTSIAQYDTLKNIDDRVQYYNQNNILMSDTNDRLVDSDPSGSKNRVILDACEITNMSTGYGSNGAPVMETYSFFARDIIIP